ncbi:hypothetical protein [Kitasatospora kifunensis]|uniref:Uncharacterized protein n=1 Tax=Kitasatospora kifunensis TaxID=58351 RepID=A0A7W7QYS7_KITKI|nr:hypothetical protein [Kitasatospora kifunensis]MBB4922209.1 hypothetical protein [Kitasatospora kifunensis]
MTAPEEWIEWAYYFEYPDGARDLTRLASAPWPSKRAEFERESAHGQFRAIAHDDPETRLVFVSRRVTYTPWTDEETS